jgi:hypothetical protein
MFFHKSCVYILIFQVVSISILFSPVSWIGYRVDANQDPDPTFRFNIAPDSDPNLKLENQNFFTIVFIHGNAS